MSGFTDFAREELTRAGMFDKDGDYGGMLGDAVMKMIEQFAEEGHSGFSASMAISLFERLARWEPITPLTGEADEWNDVGEGMLQNRRCPHIFKENGTAYNSQGIVWRDPDGCTFTNRDSRVPITFPHTPKTEVRDRPT